MGSDRPAVGATLRAQAGKGAHVVAVGRVSDHELRLLYAGAAAVVVPSLFEGFGLPAVEAMAAGVPVVVSDAGSLPEVVGDAGTIVPAGCVDSLRDALYRIAFAIDPAERERLIWRGLLRSRQFSWERSARATFAAYEQVVAGTA
jgi:glycosyltransferase involved in cell wall biosynthesis